MCIMHAPINRKTIGVASKYNRQKRRVKISFNKELMKPDPDFVDERKKVVKVEKKGFFDKLLGV